MQLMLLTRLEVLSRGRGRSNKDTTHIILPNLGKNARDKNGCLLLSSIEHSKAILVGHTCYNLGSRSPCFHFNCTQVTTFKPATADSALNVTTFSIQLGYLFNKQNKEWYKQNITECRFMCALVYFESSSTCNILTLLRRA